jgi:F-type H+-transporting ATPase subunit delta
MSSVQSLARPYARAAFELARGSQALAQWSQQLALLKELASAPAIVALLKSPQVSQAQKVAMLLPPSVAAESTLAQYLAVLADNDRLSLLPHIADLFEQHKADAERTLKVRVRAAAEIEPEQAERIKAALAKRFNRSIELTVVLEPELLGGAIIDAGEVVIDGSLKGKIARMQHALAA